MTKEELQGLLNRINAMTSGNIEDRYEFIQLVKQCAEKLQTLQQQDKSPMLDAWLTMGLQEIRKELTGRLKGGLEDLSADKQKTEFMYSKSTVSMALTNILMHL
jgi:hypothetical protein